MRILRENPLTRYFQQFEPIDRATLLIVAGLALALGLSISAIARSRVVEQVEPSFISPSFETRTV